MASPIGCHCEVHITVAATKLLQRIYAAGGLCNRQLMPLAHCFAIVTKATSRSSKRNLNNYRSYRSLETRGFPATRTRLPLLAGAKEEFS